MSEELIQAKSTDNGLYTLLPNVGLLEEFAEYGSNLKAKIVYRKCLQNRKFEIAKRIKEKYNLVEKHDDTVMALGFALMAQANCR
jgi:hypothetical protein